MDNQVMQNEQVKSGRTFFSALYEKLLLLILATVLGALLGFGLGILRVNPVYTETTSVMLITDFKTASGNNASNTSKITLAQLYLPNIEMILTSSEFIEATNESYKEQGGESAISASKINIDYSEEGSLIFNISYTDSSYELAEDKLDVVVETAKEILKTKLVADNVELKETTNVNTQSEHYNYTKYIIVGLAVGLLASVGYVTIRYLMDNTIKDREEVERLTGVNVLAYIDAIPDEVFTHPQVKEGEETQDNTKQTENK